MNPPYDASSTPAQLPDNGSGGTPPKNWLTESILVTLFCCLPFGIAGIVSASNVNSRYSVGDHAGAARAAAEARKWTRIGFFCGLGVVAIYLLMMALGMGSFLAMRPHTATP